jgi:spermidine/putrescine transport system ATP-binding protein
LSDRIAVMRGGRIEQIGEAEELYERPRTRFVAQFLGSCNLLEASLHASGDRKLLAQTAIGMLCLEVDSQPALIRDRQTFTLGIRPEKVRLCRPAEAPGENTVPARVDQLIYHGSETHYLLSAGKHQLRATALNTSLGGRGFEVGEEAVLYLPPAGMIVLED